MHVVPLQLAEHSCLLYQSNIIFQNALCCGQHVAVNKRETQSPSTDARSLATVSRIFGSGARITETDEVAAMQRVALRRSEFRVYAAFINRQRERKSRLKAELQTRVACLSYCSK